MPAASARRKKAKVASGSAPNDEDVPIAAGTSGPSTLRRRNLRGRRGSLQDLPKMPLDILFEVPSKLALLIVHVNLTFAPDFLLYAAYGSIESSKDDQRIPRPSDVSYIGYFLEGGSSEREGPSRLPFFPERTCIRQRRV